jgi:hypothetical protein
MSHINGNAETEASENRCREHLVTIERNYLGGGGGVERMDQTHIVDHHNLYSSSNIIRVTEPVREIYMHST